MHIAQFFALSIFLIVVFPSFPLQYFIYKMITKTYNIIKYL